MDLNASVTVTLSRNDFGQILDALYCRLESWQETERYFLTGRTESDGVINDCRDAEEARSIVSVYEGIIASMEKQLDRTCATP